MLHILSAFIVFLPVAFYVLYIIHFDIIKPEPPRALLLSALVGGIAALAVISIGMPSNPFPVDTEGGYGFMESLDIGFVRLALPAEVAKWLLLCIFLSLNRFYDEYLDGIVYSVCLAMGFMGVWGFRFLCAYVDTPSTFFIEIIQITVMILIPIHFISGTFMGYFLGLARKKHRVLNHILALSIPILTSGFLCTFVMMAGRHWTYYFAMGIILSILAAITYTQIFRLQRMDRDNA